MGKRARINGPAIKKGEKIVVCISMLQGGQNLWCPPLSPRTKQDISEQDISSHENAHTGKKLQATFECLDCKIRNSGGEPLQQILIIVGDGLQRHNLALSQGLNPEDFWGGANKMGEDWIKENSTTIRPYSEQNSVYRWAQIYHQTKGDPAYSELKSLLDNCYEKDPSFQRHFNQTLGSYLSQKKREGLDEETKGKVRRSSIEYIKEEMIALWLYGIKERINYLAYPQKELQVMVGMRQIIKANLETCPKLKAALEATGTDLDHILVWQQIAPAHLSSVSAEEKSVLASKGRAALVPAGAAAASSAEDSFMSADDSGSGSARKRVATAGGALPAPRGDGVFRTMSEATAHFTLFRSETSRVDPSQRPPEMRTVDVKREYGKLVELHESVTKSFTELMAEAQAATVDSDAYKSAMQCLDALRIQIQCNLEMIKRIPHHPSHPGLLQVPNDVTQLQATYAAAIRLTSPMTAAGIPPAKGGTKVGAAAASEEGSTGPDDDLPFSTPQSGGWQTGVGMGRGSQ